MAGTFCMLVVTVFLSNQRKCIGEDVEAADSEEDVEASGEAEGAMTRDRQRELCLWGTSHTPVRRI